MARQEVNIGVEGNDGTGDSIRESFRKTNENFSELYAVFGQGGTIRFTALSDTPDQLTANTIPLVNDAATAVQLVTLASNSAIDPGLQDTITFSFNQTGKLIISTAFTEMSDDLTPTLGGPLFANNNPIAKVAISDAAAANFATSHAEAVTIDDLVISKGYADKRYIIGATGEGSHVRIADEPASITQYTLTISRYLNNNLEVLNHGFDSSVNGTAYIFNAEDTDPSGLTTGTTYYIRRVDENFFSLHTSAETAASENQDTANTTKVPVSGSIAADDTHALVDKAYDPNLYGNFLSDVALPRKSIVRRQGDDMEGSLYLHDHPGELSGAGYPNGIEDLQAATKFYVDNTSYSSPTNLYVSTKGDNSMSNVPNGKEGTSLTYAYKTIGAAAKRATELVRASAIADSSSSPYNQTITKNGGDDFAEVTTSEVDAPVYVQTRQLIDNNRDYIVAEVTGYLKFNFSNHSYDSDACELDTGLILDSVALDINRGLNSNSLTRSAAERYYSNASSRKAITTQLTETLAAINFTKNLADSLMQNNLYNEKTVNTITKATTAIVTTNGFHGFSTNNIVIFKISSGMTELNEKTAYIKKLSDTEFELFTDKSLAFPYDTSAFTTFTAGTVGLVHQTEVSRYTDATDADISARLAVGTKFDLITNIMQNGIAAGSDTVFGSSYKVVLNNGGLNFVDQADPSNIDILPGKIVSGARSNALGQIISLTSNDATESNNDTIQVHLLSPKEFEVGESILFGNRTKTKNITIVVESGTYEEDYPIKLPENTSIEGDNFRRVIIQPRNRVSQSEWANTYFYRDKEFDGLALANTGSPFLNQSGVEQGFFGFHYLVDADKPLNVGPAITNVGNYNNAAEIIRLNKKFIQNEVVERIEDIKPNITFNEARCRRDTEIILKYTAMDMALNTNYNSVTAGIAYQRSNAEVSQTSQKDATIGGIRYAHHLVNALTEIEATPLGAAKLKDGFDEIVEILDSWDGSTAETDTADVLIFNNPTTSAGTDANVNKTNARKQLQANRAFLTAEVIAYITANHPTLVYDSVKCARDVRYIIDAVSYDVQYGGNSASRQAADSYYVDGVSQLGAGQATAVTAAYNFLATIAAQVIVETDVTELQVGETQDISGTPATATEATEVDGLLQIIEDVITAGNVSGLPAETLPSVTWSATEYQTARTSILSNTLAIQNSVITFINDNFVNPTYDHVACKRDVGLIVDAVKKDLQKGGGEYVTEIQGEYYYNYIAKWGAGGFLGHEAITRDATNFISTIADRLFTGTYASNLILQNQAAADYIAPILTLTGEAGTDTVVSELTGRVAFAFNIAFNPPKRNDELDIFLMNDATVITNVTGQGHGGFMCVLDPEGQILTKSPYVFSSSSFSKSKNVKTFAGGMYLDAYTGNSPMYVPQTIDPGVALGGSQNGKINNFTLWVRSLPGQGLFIREPLLPCPFYVEGRRYQVNAISDYDSGNGWCKIYLDADSNETTGYDETEFANGLYYRDIFLQTAGNRSTLAQAFTQINDLGYGVIATNGAFSEQVSVFTYYNAVAFYAYRGSEIRTLNCSNGYGNFGLVAEEADPNEIPDQISLKDVMNQPTKVVTTATTPNASGDTSIYVTDLKYVPMTNSQITIAHGGNTGTLNYNIKSITAMSDLAGDGNFGAAGDTMVTGAESVTITSGASDSGRTAGTYLVQATGGASKTITETSNNNPVIVTTSADHRLRDGSLITISGIVGMTELNGNTYYTKIVEDSSVDSAKNFALYSDESLTTTVDGNSFTAYVSGGTVTGGGAVFSVVIAPTTGTATITVNRPGEGYATAESLTLAGADVGGGTPTDIVMDVTAFASASGQGVHNNNLWKFDLKEDAVFGLDFYGTLQDTVTNDTIIDFRNSSTHILDLIREPTALNIRPNTAINFDESDLVTYRSIDFQVTNPYGTALANDEITTTFETGFDFLELETSVGNMDGGLGSAQGDTKIAIITLGATETTRITRDLTGKQPGDAGYAGGMLFTWNGKTHQVTNIETDSTVQYVTIQDIADTNINSGYSGTGLNSALPITSVTLTLGLGANATAEMTIGISLVRATGHDFQQIGTGSFNDSNFPKILLGEPENALATSYTDSATATSAQVWERRKGRVFYVSTDQFGFFRVGKFFSVDQATGLITFAGDIGISSADSLGFKRGVTIDEFSSDDSMSDESGSAVPTERAITGYIDRRLGFTTSAQVLPSPSGNRIGPGFLPLNGVSEMEGALQLGNNQVINVALPGTDGTAATNKNYVDARIQEYDELNEVRDIELNNVAANDLLIATGKKRIVVTPPTGVGFTIGQTIQKVGVPTTSGTIVDLEVTTDQILGSVGNSYAVTIITYTVTGNPFVLTDSITNSTDTATILFAPIDEFANASEDGSSDINISSTRAAGSTTFNLQIAAGSIINADVDANAAIAQSKLNLTAASTRANATGITQADLGVASFSSTNFDTTNGWVELKSGGLTIGNLPNIDQNKVLGRSSAGNGNVEEVAMSDVVTTGGGLIDGDFTNTIIDTDTGFPGEALIKLSAGVYGVATVSDDSTGDTMVRRKTSGAIQANSYIIGGTDTFEILSEASGVLSLKTPGQGTILTASGATPVVKIPQILDVGGTNITAEGNFQAASSYTGEKFIATDWVYTNFIEAQTERDADSTGIGLGAGTGFTGAGADVVQIITGGLVRLSVADATTTVTNDLQVDGNTTLGDATTDTLTVTARLNADLLPNADNTINLGQGGGTPLRFNTIHSVIFSGTATTARYADLAEKYIADAEYEPGTVLVLGGEEEVTTTSTKGDHRVAGVVSTNPAYLMNSDLEAEYPTEVAIAGRVPCKVLGPVSKGDMLVASAIPGYAIVDNNPRLGSVIGKSVVDKTDDGKSTIEIIVGKV